MSTSRGISRITSVIIIVVIIVLGGIGLGVYYSSLPTATRVSSEQVSFRAEDGYLLSGMLLSASSASKIGVILVPGAWYGGIGSDQFFAKIPSSLAAKGYSVLSFDPRRHSSFSTSIFEDGVKDIRAAVRFMSSRGINGVFLAGHSSGTDDVTYYVSSTKDTAVVALGLYSPSGNWKFILRDRLGQRYYAITNQSRTLVKNGQGTQMVYTLVCGSSPGCPPPVHVSAQTWLSYFGPDSNDDITRNIRSVSLSVLIMAHQSDTGVRSAISYYGNATQSVKRDLKIYTTPIAGNPHYFQGVEDQVVQDTASWLGSLPQPASSIRPIFLQVEAVDCRRIDSSHF